MLCFGIACETKTYSPKSELSKAAIHQVCRAIDMFEKEQGRKPKLLKDLSERPAYIEASKWPQSPYLGSVPLDGWGRELQFRAFGTNGRPYDVFSLGSDGAEGGEGEAKDIFN